MLTVEDVTAIPLFSTLPRQELERLARTSADLHLGPGEFAVPEGGERALFAVLSGKIEVVKTIDGVERTPAGASLALFLARYPLRLAPRSRADIAPRSRPV